MMTPKAAHADPAQASQPHVVRALTPRRISSRLEWQTLASSLTGAMRMQQRVAS